MESMRWVDAMRGQIASQPVYRQAASGLEGRVGTQREEMHDDRDEAAILHFDHKSVGVPSFNRTHSNSSLHRTAARARTTS